MFTELLQFGWGSSREENHSYLHAAVLCAFVGRAKGNVLAVA